MRKILKYNEIVEFANTKFKEPNKEIKRLFMKHKLTKEDKKILYIINKFIKYYWSTYPHRCLLVLNDFVNHPLLRHKENEMYRLLKKLRYFNINLIIYVQTIKSIRKDIKRTLSDIILFSGIGEDDFIDLIKESLVSILDKKLLWNEYSKLTNPQEMFRIYIKARKIVITKPI